MLGGGHPVRNGVIDTGDGRLLFTAVKQVLANNLLHDSRYNCLYVFCNFSLQQMHEGDYVCRVDNGVGPVAEAVIKLLVKKGKFHIYQRINNDFYLIVFD